MVELALFAVITAAMTFVAISPAWMLWFIAARWRRDIIQLPANKMMAVTFVLSIISLFVFDIELEGGILSLPFLLALISLLWTIGLMPISLLFTHYAKKKAIR